MAHTGETTRGRGVAQAVDTFLDDPAPDRGRRGPVRDWKKLLLVVGLGVLSWVATFVGMLELIEANMGELPLVHKAIVGFSVAMLMVMVVWLLDQMFSDIGWFTRLLFGAGYVFLTIISVGFGFGFYWKVLESRSEASRSAESAIGQVQTSLHAAMTRLEQLQSTLDSLTSISSQKADTERNTGTSCPNSKPGDGPRRKMRDDDASRFKFASDFVKSRVGTVRTDIGGLDGDLAKIVRNDRSTMDAAGTRNEFMRNLGRRLDMTVTGFNAFRTDPQLKQIRIDLAERADKVTFVDTKGGTYTCPDGQLTTALKGVVRAIDELPVLEKPKIAAVEGSEAVIEAFRRLTATFYGALSFKLPPSPEELRELQKKAVQSVEGGAATQAKLNAMAEQAGLSKRDYVPLAVALFVDLCLLLVSMKKPGSRLERLRTRMDTARSGPVGQVMQSFSAVHGDDDFRRSFEVFRHVIFDFHGDYYAAVPLNAPYRPNTRNHDQQRDFGTRQAQQLLEEAHLLGNLFASFEKEKIFTRVWSPLLSTRTIQKRLARQGSKFANAEAFRVYRFKDGAWSEMILGAVMGAADRIEHKNRRRRVEEELFAATGPTLDRAAASEATQPPRTSRTAGTAGAGRAVLGRDAEADRTVDGTERGGDLSASLWRDRRPLRPAPTAVVMIDRAVAPDFAGQAADADTASDRAARPAATARHDARAAAEIASAIPAQSRHPANNNTAPSARLPAGTPVTAEAEGQNPAQAMPPPPRPTQPVRMENVIPLPAGRPAGTFTPAQGLAVPGPSVEVEARRETITYRVPVSEAAMPAGLLEAMSTSRPGRRETELDALPLPADPLPAIAQALAGELAVRSEPAVPPPPRTRAMPPPVPTRTIASDGNVIAMPAAAGDVSAQSERRDWDDAHAAGWRNSHDAALTTHTADADETRSLALRLRPTRDG